MKIRLTFILFQVLLATTVITAQSTMTFDSGPNEPGFSFTNWKAGAGVIFQKNLPDLSTISKDAGTWNLISFRTKPFGNSGNFEATSDLSHSYIFNPNTGGQQTHTLNWAGITTLTITRINPSAGSYDFDDVVYCNLPFITTDPTDATKCPGDAVTFTVAATGSN
ncbi:MAG: hypothetical protein V3V00_08940, partial [Saprospiraceae bacterium]